jgi:hypothetical protein
MNVTRRGFLGLAAAACTAGLSACTSFGQQSSGNTSSNNTTNTDNETQQSSVNLNEFSDLALDMGAWRYDETNDCYYQLGISYCLKPATTTYESLAIFVPGAYFKGEKRLSGTYKCSVIEDATKGSFTSATAPILMPINSSFFEGQACPTAYSYDGLSSYLEAGYIYVYAGFRGRSATIESDSSTTDVIAGGAPWAVVDMKAAIRYLRYNASSLPCDTSRIFVYGFGGGGGISACLGSMGDADLFSNYLSSIGAATHDGSEGKSISDVIMGAAAWSPLMSFDQADAGYEWMAGQFSSQGQRAEGSWTKLLSSDLASSYGDFINQMDLRDDSGNQLTLDVAEDGSFVSGSYYDYILGIVEDAASTFLSQTVFPYTYTPDSTTTSIFPGDPNLTSTQEINASVDSKESSSTSTSQSISGVTTVQSTVYDSVESYVSTLNGSGRWLVYNSRKQTALLTDLWNYVSTCSPATRGVGAYDASDRSTTINQLFGIGEESTLHFDTTISELVTNRQEAYSACSDWDAQVVDDWADDIAKEDSIGSDMAQRVAMLNPLYYLSGHYAGYGTATVAPYWRVNEALFQSDIPLTCGANLVRALKHYDGIKDISFTPVWGTAVLLAERSGSAEDNLLTWVAQCCAKEQ